MRPSTIQTRGAQTRPTEFLVGEHQIRSGLMARASAGGTTIGVVKGGSALGRITATGELRPCGKTAVDGIQPGVNTVTVDESAGFRVGDVISAYSTAGIAAGTATLDGDGGGTANIEVNAVSTDGKAHSTTIVAPTLGVRGTLTINADGAGANISVTGAKADGLAHTIALVDPAANDEEIRVDATIAAGVATIRVMLATGGAGAIISTVNEVCQVLNTQASEFVVCTAASANVAIAVAGAPLAGGVAAPVDRDLKAEQTLTAGDVETITVTLGLNALGTALASTVNEVIGAANAASDYQEYRLAAGGVGGNTAAAVGNTPLSGGVATGATLMSGRNITAIPSSTSITFDGGAVSFQADDTIQLANGAQTAVGYSIGTVDTFVGRSAAGVEVHSAQPIEWTSAGKVRTAGLVYTNSLIQADLTLIEHLSSP